MTSNDSQAAAAALTPLEPVDAEHDAAHWWEVGGQCESVSKSGFRCTYCTGHDDIPTSYRRDPRVATHPARERTPAGDIPFGTGLYGGSAVAAWDGDGNDKPYYLPPE